ncbi:MAG: chloride channel protein [Corynebacterium flavescens]|uniref:chloride channel protein n=1 Tax=Corynebacterium flavescens TaxID=28028 RepID=UPI003F9AE542
MRLRALAAWTVLGGLGAGLTGMATTFSAELLISASPHGGWPMVLTAAIGGLLAGLGWWALRASAPVRTPEQALRDGGALPALRTLGDGALQLLAVGTGSSLGREKAPRQIAGCIQYNLAAGVPDSERRLLLAAAASAGLAAVYNIPFAGAVFAFEVLRIKKSRRNLAVVIAMSLVAAITAWPVVGNGPFYSFPSPSPTPTHVLWMALWSLIAAVAGGGLGFLFRRGADYAAAHHTPARWYLPLATALAATGVACTALILPQVLGNGFGIVALAFSQSGSWQIFLALALCKPLLTVACLRAGAVGGMLTPSLATGAALGACIALALPHLPADALSTSGFALIGAAAVLAASQRAPFFAATIAWELTNAPWWMLPLLLISCWGAHYLWSKR